MEGKQHSTHINVCIWAYEAGELARLQGVGLLTVFFSCADIFGIRRVPDAVLDLVQQLPPGVRSNALCHPALWPARAVVE